MGNTKCNNKAFQSIKNRTADFFERLRMEKNIFFRTFFQRSVRSGVIHSEDSLQLVKHRNFSINYKCRKLVSLCKNLFGLVFCILKNCLDPLLNVFLISGFHPGSYCPPSKIKKNWTLFWYIWLLLARSNLEGMLTWDTQTLLRITMRMKCYVRKVVFLSAWIRPEILKSQNLQHWWMGSSRQAKM